MADEHVVYAQALETVRSVTNQVVSTGGIFVVGFVTVVGFSFTNRSSLLLGASSIFMIALWALLRRWQRILWSSLEVAEGLEPSQPSLVAGLTKWVGRESDGLWTRTKWKVHAPLVVAAIAISAAVAVEVFVDAWAATGNPI